MANRHPLTLLSSPPFPHNLPGKHASMRIKHTVLAIHLALSGLAMSSLPLPGLAQSNPTTGMEASHNFDIPAGSLSQVLNTFASTASVELSVDANLLKGKISRGLHGNFSVQNGFAELLRSHGLQAVRQNNGSYTLLRTSDTSSQQGEAVLPEVIVRGSGNEITGHIDGYVAKRSTIATKTDTSLLETPQSISVVTADRIEAIGATTLRDALAYTPGVNISPYGPDSRFESTWFFLRGFDTYNPGPNMDGLPLRNNYTWAVWQTENYGIERIDILRGPSSVLYGQTSPGGTVNVTSKRPTEEPLRELEVQLGSFNRKQIAGDFSGPIDEDGKLLYRLTAVVRDAEYPVKGIADDRVYIAPSLTIKPDADTSLTLLSHYLRGRAGVYSRPVMANGTLVANLDGSYIPSTYVGDPLFDHMEQDQWAIGYAFDHRFNDTWTVRQNLRYGEIRSRLAHVFAGQGYIEVNSANPADPANFRSISRSVFGSNEDARVFSVDNQLQGKFRQSNVEHTVLLGLDYQRASFDQSSYFGDANAPLNLYAPVYGQSISIPAPYFVGRTELEQTGLYGQLQSKIDERFVITLGGRYDRATTKTSDYLNASNSSQSDGKFTGRAGLVYLMPSGWAPYVSYSESFYPTTTINPATDKAFTPETAQQQEIGLRYQPVGTNDSYSIAAFNLRRQNYITSDPATTQPRQTGEITVRGLELEALFSPMKNLQLTASYAWTPKAEVTASSNPSELGHNTNGVSKQMGSLWAEYKITSRLKAGLGARYIGPNHGYNDSAPAKVPGYALFDALLGYEIDHWSFRLNIRNLTDKTYFASCSDTSCYYGDERRINLTASYRW